MKRHPIVQTLVTVAILACLLAAALPATGQSIYDQWSRGPSTSESFFPIAVWLQAPGDVYNYRSIGVNIYVGLWQGPTQTQLNTLSAAGMYTICSQNSTGLANITNPTIIGWLQQDEPDNAQANPSGGYYSPVAPLPTTTWDTNPSWVTDIYTRYLGLKANDSTRPVLLNLGQAVGWDGYIGRGIRTNHPEDYPEYIQGCDMVSFDIYPVASGRPEVDNNLWLVPYGVDRLVSWSQADQPVWNWIECTNISGDGKATPTQVKAEVWMSLIHGSIGIGYFCHQIDPTFNENALLDDAVMRAAVSDINWQIYSLAPVLNSPTITDPLNVTSSNPGVPIDSMVKRVNGINYIFSVAMRDGPTTATYYGPNLPPIGVAEVIGEGRELPVMGGWFSDGFSPYGVHLYRILSRFPGDADGDSDVDLDDFTALKNDFGLSSGARWDQGDFDKDGDIDLDDFTMLKANFGFVYP